MIAQGPAGVGQAGDALVLLGLRRGEDRRRSTAPTPRCCRSSTSSTSTSFSCSRNSIPTSPSATSRYNPKFDSISGDYIADDLHDFLEVFLPLNLDADWKRIFHGAQGIPEHGRDPDRRVDQADARAQGRTNERRARADRPARQEGSLPAHSPRASGERIVEPFIDKLKNQMTMLMQKIAQERRTFEDRRAGQGRLRHGRRARA